jgi:cobalt/nickel transport protein
MRRIGIAMFALTLAASTSFAHYNMLLPDKAWANKGDKVTFTYQFGHPFEHELFDAPKPIALAVITPNGKTENLRVDKTLAPIKKDGADGKKVTAWQFTYAPAERGDYTFVLKTARIKHEEDKFVEDTVKVALHVQTQNGWEDASSPFPKSIDILPYTRPYGLLPGMVFRGQVVRPEKGAGAMMVEIEKYNPKPMKMLPPDELITFKTKTDDNNFFVTTLPSPGWWGVTAVGREGQRTTLWIHVDEKK